ncbi:hemolysin-III related-domain-containing protein [Fennellomyces sp. T-0311]|nr:hemolysin-III related-domain-containing protein [Fennellomyces sp. T-0311]
MIISTNEKKHYQAILKKKSLNRSTSDDNSTADYNSIPRTQQQFMEKTVPPIKKTLLNWSEIPEWMRFNPYILTGYRSPSASYNTCVQSITEIHNETMNIWTHMFGLIVTVILFFQYFFLQDEWSSQTGFGALSMTLFFISCTICLSCSCVYHTFACHSKNVSVACNCIDYFGITMLIIGSWLPAYHYYFYCEPKWQVAYTAVMLIAGAATATMMIVPRFQAEEYLLMRTVLFFILGFWGIIAFIHSGFLHGFSLLREIGVDYILVMGLFYIAGALLYGSRVPERWFPGSFDLWFQSHSIFHISMMVGLGFYYTGMLKARDYWAAMGPDEQCSASSPFM